MALKNEVRLRESHLDDKRDINLVDVKWIFFILCSTPISINRGKRYMCVNDSHSNQSHGNYTF